jgi:hypothetical protein
MLDKISTVSSSDEVVEDIAGVERAPPNISDPPSSSNTLAEPSGTLSDIGQDRLLPVPLPEPSMPVSHRRGAAPALPVGILLYLVSIGLIATATIGVFFGIGFLLLTEPREEIIPNARTSGHVAGIKPLLHSLVPRFFSNLSPADGKVATISIEAEIPQPVATAALPTALPLQPSAVEQTALPDKRDAPPSGIGDAPSSATKDTSSRDEPPKQQAHDGGPAARAPAGAAVEPAPRSGAATAPTAPSGPRLSAEEIAQLLARGDTFLGVGDVISARLFYQRAADAGDGQAAWRMGATFDPGFLGQAGLRGVRSDPVEAQSWYRHAIDLNAAGADRHSDNLKTK